MLAVLLVLVVVLVGMAALIDIRERRRGHRRRPSSDIAVAIRQQRRELRARRGFGYQGGNTVGQRLFPRGRRTER